MLTYDEKQLRNKVKLSLSKQTIKTQELEIKLLEDGLKDLKYYCSSVKFKGDKMVNTEDIILRIREIQQGLLNFVLEDY